MGSKFDADSHRRNPVDLFDLLYTIVFRDQFGVNRREVITTFLRKSLFEQEPIIAREQLRAVPIAQFESLWKSLVAPIASLFAFDFVLANFQGLLDSLFALVILPTPAFAGAPAPPPIGRLGGVGRPIRVLPTYFSSDIRNTIIGAGRSRTMVELSYDSHTRFVEPYKLEYYVRKKDNRGLEYFWGWDTSGGKSGKIGIKQFICDKIQSVRPTTRAYQPRFAIEL